MGRIKKFFRDLFVAASAFYLPMIVPPLLCISLGIEESHWEWAYSFNIIIPAAASLAVFFWATSRWKEKPSPMVTLLGVWIGGPVSFIPGTYLGFLGGLIFLAFFYPIFSLCRLVRLKPSYGTALGAALISTLAAGLTVYVTVSGYDSRYPLNENPLFQSLAIQDVTRAETLTLFAGADEKNVYSLHLHAEGELDGKALIHTANSENRTESQEIGPGKFQVGLGGDWYEPTCFLSYDPGTVHAGHLIIYYAFDSLDSNKAVELQR